MIAINTSQWSVPWFATVEASDTIFVNEVKTLDLGLRMGIKNKIAHGNAWYSMVFQKLPIEREWRVGMVNEPSSKPFRLKK